ncbi:MAG: pre-16S rRNA-processing nuclease YqgF, partial [Sporomusa sp.]
MSVNIVLAIDPGREKCGLAVVHKEQGVICKAVINTTDLAAAANQLVAAHRLTTVVIGDGTTSRTAQTTLATITVNDKPLTIIPVNEYRSTDEARTLYWRDN